MICNLAVVVDDNRSWAETVRQILRRQGWAVHIADDGQAALRMLSQTEPALVILDVHMQPINGFDVLRSLRRQRRRAPVLMMSAQDDGLADRARCCGADAFLVKSASLQALRNAVDRLVTEKRQRPVCQDRT